MDAVTFLDMVNDAVIPMAAVGIQYFGGPVITILASKTSRMYNTLYHHILVQTHLHEFEAKRKQEFELTFQ